MMQTEQKIQRPTSLPLRFNYNNGSSQKEILDSPALKLLGITSPELDNMVLNMDTGIINKLQKLDNIDENRFELDKPSTSIICPNGVNVAQLSRPFKTAQEKLEIKRLKNRIAATKCRQKKIKRIYSLEQKRDELNIYNKSLLNYVQRLRIEINVLNQELLSHYSRGCVEVGQFLKFSS